MIHSPLMDGSPAMRTPLSVPPLSPLSILHVAMPERVGGLESVVLALATGQSRAGHDVRVAVIDTEERAAHAFVEALAGSGVDAIHIRVPVRAYLRERAAMAALCRGRAPQLVHTHGNRCDVVDGGQARALGIPTVTTLHGVTHNHGVTGRLSYWLQSRSLPRFAAVVAVSQSLHRDVARKGVSRDRLHLIPNAYDASVPLLSRSEARRALSLPLQGTVVGWVGRLSREKGLDILIEAMGRLRSSNVTLVVVGDGPEREKLRLQAAALGGGERIRWCGVLPNAARLLAALDVFVLSSRSEGSPIILMEAMAAGLPIVATSVGGVPETVSSLEAVLIPSERSDLLARAIDDVLKEPARAAELARAARRRVTVEHSPEMWVAQYDAVYRGIIHARKSR